MIEIVPRFKSYLYIYKQTNKQRFTSTHTHKLRNNIFTIHKKYLIFRKKKKINKITHTRTDQSAVN